jgi:hypothetical protein
MAGTLTITCGECKKVMQVPEVLAGKRIRCRGCNATLTVKKPGGAKAAVPAKAVPAQAVPAQVAKPDTKDDEWAKATAYGIEKPDDAPRCAYCANDMEEGQVVCLKCGYNMQTRVRHSTKVVHVQSGGDYFMWHLPAAICTLVIITCIAFLVIVWTETPDLGELGEYIQKWRWGAVYTTVFLAFIMFFCGRFAVKRFIYNPHPPEFEKFEHDQDDDDDDDEEEDDDEDDEEE